MAVTLKKLENDELPTVYRRRNIAAVFQVTGDDGEIFYLDTEEDAAALVAKLHLKDQQDDKGEF